MRPNKIIESFMRGNLVEESEYICLASGRDPPGTGWLVPVTAGGAPPGPRPVSAHAGGLGVVAARVALGSGDRDG